MQKKDDIFNLVPLGDIHIGNEACDQEALTQKINEILADENKFTIGMGDYLENNGIVSRMGLNKHVSEQQIADSPYPTVERQITKFLELWSPLIRETKTFPMGKTIGLHVGNHEDRTIKGEGFVQRICQPLELVQKVKRKLYLGDFAFTKLSFIYRGQVVSKFTVVSAHGTNFGGQRLGTVLNAAHQKFTQYAFDVALFGHTHFAGVEKFNRGDVVDMGEGLGYVEQKHLIANTGAFVRSHLEGVDLYTDKQFGSLRNKGTITVTFAPYESKVYAHV